MALHHAAAAGRDELMPPLLSRYAAKNARTRDGQTALMLAAAAGHELAVGILVDHGADLGVKDPAGRSALDIARAAKHAKIVARIEHGPHTPRPAVVAAKTFMTIEDPEEA
jgi:ankyrin repeat protein